MSLYKVDNRWFRGSARIPTYALEELLGTKLRALYQRAKGRDLYDFAVAFERESVDDAVVVDCFRSYMAINDHTVTRAQFEENLVAKMASPAFREDIVPLLRPGSVYDAEVACRQVLERLVSRLEGEPWRGLVLAGSDEAPMDTDEDKD